jgi:hypothetical protein
MSTPKELAADDRHRHRERVEGRAKRAAYLWARRRSMHAVRQWRRRSNGRVRRIEAVVEETYELFGRQDEVGGVIVSERARGV